MNQDEAEQRRRDLIEKRAYEIYKARGGFDGLADEDWFEAERQIDLLPADPDELPVGGDEDEEQPDI